jgi:LmbE family N-acetylglucosaminyl deacetylase
MTMKVSGSALFLFAHQDDEFGVFAQIEWELRVGRRVLCVYVTDGAANANSDLRDAESRAVLQKLGVPMGDIIFIGPRLDIGDGQLHRHVGTFANWLNGYVNLLAPTLNVCFVPAWEGGHPDHDLLHAIAVEVLLTRENPPTVWQYPLYNGQGCFGPFFRSLSPLLNNGSIQRQPIAWRDRLRYIRLCLYYPSQWRSWLGLFPFVAGHYLINGAQYLQGVSRQRLEQPPHLRPLYYERRGFLDWSSLHAAFEQLRDRD